MLYKATDFPLPLFGLILPLWASDTLGLGPSDLPFLEVVDPFFALDIFSHLSFENFFSS